MKRAGIGVAAAVLGVASAETQDDVALKSQIAWNKNVALRSVLTYGLRGPSKIVIEFKEGRITNESRTVRQGQSVTSQVGEAVEGAYKRHGDKVQAVYVI